MQKTKEAYTTRSDSAKLGKHNIPLVHRTIMPKFNAGNKVTVASDSSPYNHRKGVVDKPPFSDTFCFWYIVKFDSKEFTAVSQFAEEELEEVGD
jgi:hypothetical protein